MSSAPVWPAKILWGCERFGQTCELDFVRDRWMEVQLLKSRQVAATEEYRMKATNHSLKLLIFMLLFSTGVTLFTARVGAQDGGWQIMRADYGFKAQRTDVTDILRDLISRGGVNGRVAINNQTMGGDPAVGRDKSLRIFARNRRNEEREFNVNEGGFIDARMFAVRKDDWDERAPAPAREDRSRDDRSRDDRDR